MDIACVLMTFFHSFLSISDNAFYNILVTGAHTACELTDFENSLNFGSFLCLVQESLLAMNKLRKEVELEKSRAKLDSGGCEKDLEMCIRAKNNAWVISRITRGKELYMVLEKANETLLYASDAVEKFSNRYVFLSFVCLIVYSCVNCYPYYNENGTET